jgi:hypothetical protein
VGCILIDIQDFTTFTEVDASGVLSQTSSKATFTNMLTRRPPSVYIYKDYGEGYFGLNFIHDFTIYISDMNSYGLIGVYGLLNIVGSVYSSSDIMIDIYAPYGANPIIRFTLDPTKNCTFSVLQLRYIRIIRDAATLTMEIYSDAERTALISTLSTTISATNTYRYLSTSSNAIDNSYYAPASGYIESLGFYEEVPSIIYSNYTSRDRFFNTAGSKTTRRIIKYIFTF